MPQLSPMSWFMVISVFLICLVFFAVVLWWLIDGKYEVGYSNNKGKVSSKKNFMKWGFGGGLVK
uniref:ATP synthase F0 subunit 8 n=1 Tax=Anodonta nuttalliana TaxID=358454 RepID=A0A7U0FPR3_9BIVA|nr:ATP synthase F0 subunit 8 [Anodonta nuttalliana]QQV69699.1 ATP synthase F0 subunit 8 [Anodonta nuttalliana]